MTQYAYVMTDGVNDGTRSTATTFTSLQTGAFSGLGGVGFYYASILSAITSNTLVAGDFILCANTHLLDYGVSQLITLPDGVYVISVNETGAAINTFLAGAEERCKLGGTRSFTFAEATLGSTVYHYGMHYTVSNDFIVNIDAGTMVMGNCHLELTGASADDRIRQAADGSTVIVRNSQVTLAASGQCFRANAGSTWKLYNTVLNSATSLLFDSTGTGGGSFYAWDCNFGLLTSNMCEPSGSLGDTVNFELIRCKVNFPTVSVTSTAPIYEGQRASIYSCGTGNQYYLEAHDKFGGSVNQDLANYRSGGATYDGSTNFSYEFTPSSDAIPYHQPIRQKIKEIEIDLESANTLTFHIAITDTTTAITPSTITNKNYWIEIDQNSSATSNSALGLFKTTAMADPLATPSALANAASTWTLAGPPTYDDQFQIPIITTAVSGATKGQVTVYFCCSEHNTNREIFICPNPVVT